VIGRRTLLRGVALGAALASAQTVSACSYATYEEDDWGGRLIAFFRTGDVSKLDNLFQNFTTLVAFNEYFGVGPELVCKGANGVRDALVSFRKKMTEEVLVEPRKLIDAKVVGNKQQGRMNRIELLFAESKMSETSCGPDRSEQRVDLYYEAGVYETGEDWVKWAVERLAFLPPLEMERFND
jgi:hypothetical protein